MAKVYNNQGWDRKTRSAKRSKPKGVRKVNRDYANAPNLPERSLSWVKRWYVLIWGDQHLLPDVYSFKVYQEAVRYAAEHNGEIKEVQIQTRA